jgi:hypothetical protein
MEFIKDVFPEGGIELVGYNVEYLVHWSKGSFLAKGLIVGYKKQHKNGALSYTGGVYKIKCLDKIFNKRRCEFTVVSKNTH